MAKNKIPKRIAGVKVPKGIRRSPVLKTLLGSETGRQILGQALIAGAGAAAAALAHSQRGNIAEAGETAARKTRRGGNVAARAVKDATGAMAGVIASAAQSIMPDDAPRKGRRRAARASVTH